MGAIRDTLWGYKHQKTENLLKTFEDKVLKNEASEKNSALERYRYHKPIIIYAASTFFHDLSYQNFGR